MEIVLTDVRFLGDLHNRRLPHWRPRCARVRIGAPPPDFSSKYTFSAFVAKPCAEIVRALLLPSSGRLSILLKVQ
jgi:hypothetical protein